MASGLRSIAAQICWPEKIQATEFRSAPVWDKEYDETSLWGENLAVASDTFVTETITYLADHAFVSG
jgi:hypothetical protein